MPLLTGSVACTRFSVVAAPAEIDFDSVRFRALQPGSQLRESSGFVPYEPEESYLIGNRLWAFRIRLDQKKVDANQLKERVRELIKVERDAVGPPSMKKIQDLRKLAEEELLERQSSSTKIIECLLDDHTLYVGTVAQSNLGLVSALLLKVGVQLEFKTPWIEAGLEPLAADHVDYQDASQSILGCHFLKWLLNDPDVFPEVEQGQAKLVTGNGTTVTLKGTIQSDLDRFLDDGSDLLSLKLLFEDTLFTLDGLSFRLAGLKVNPYKSDHWTGTLQSRLDRIRDVWEALDGKFSQFMDRWQTEAPL